MTKKITAIITLLIFTIFSSTVSMANNTASEISLSSAETSIDLEFPVSGGFLTAGMSVPIEVSMTNVEGAVKLQIIKSADGEIVSESNETDKIYITIEKSNNAYYVAAVDTDGNILAQSEEFNLEGYSEANQQYIWDLDFEGCTFVPYENLTWTVLNKNGSELKSANTGATFEGHLGGSSENSIIITSDSMPENNKYGESVKVSGVSSANCQMNYMTVNSGGPVVVTSFDWAIEDYADVQVMGVKTNQDYVLPILRANSDGQFVIGTAIGTYEINKWYNIKQITDLEQRVCNTFIDNVLVNSSEVQSGVSSLVLVSSNCDNSTSTFYIDNFKAYTTEYTTIASAELSASVDNTAYMPYGVKIPVSVSISDSENIDKLQLIKVAGEVVVAENSDDFSKGFKLKLEPGENEYRVVGLDSSGNVVCESDTFTTNGYGETDTKPIWDIDFEGVTAVPNSDLGWVVFHKNGSPMKSANTNDTFEGHLGGSSSNSITVTSTGTPGNGVYGESVVVKGTTSANCQMNYMTIGSGGPVVVASYDWALKEKASTQIFAMRTNDGYVLPILRSSADGKFVIGTEIGDYEANKWYNIKQIIDMENGRCYTFIDNSLVHSADFSTSSVTNLTLISCNCDNSASTIYLDNFKAYSTTLTEQTSAVSASCDVDYPLPAGAMIPVSASVMGFDDANLLKIINEDDNSVVAQKSVDSEEDMYMTLQLGTNRYKVVATSADGTILGESESFILSGLREVNKESVWNLDFEGVTTQYDSNNAWVTFYKDSIQLKSDNAKEALEGHLGGSVDNSIIVTSSNTPQNAKNGDSVVIKGSSSANCQLNIIPLSVSGPVVTASFDWAIEEAESTQIMGIKSNAGWTLPIIRSSDDGSFVIGSKVGSYEPGKWYNIKQVIDFESGICSSFIDNTLVHSTAFDKSQTLLLSLISSNCDSSESTYYIDNLVAYACELSSKIPSLKVSCDSYDGTLIAGVKVPITITSSAIDGASIIKIVDADSMEQIAEYEATAEIETYFIIPSYSKNYKAIAVSKDGSIIAESSVFTVSGYDGAKTTIWDESFEGVSTKTASDGVYINFYRGESQLITPAGEPLQGHIGTADIGNSISVASDNTPESGKLGSCIKLISTTKANCQMNNMIVESSGPIIVVSADWAVEELAYTQAFALRANGTNWLPIVNSQDNGDLTIGTTIIGKYEAGKWYNLKQVVDMENGICDTFIDNVLVARSEFDTSEITSIVRLSISGANENSVIYVDNFNVFTLSKSPQIISASVINDYIDVSFSQDVSVGEFESGNVTLNISCNGENIPVDGVSTSSAENTIRFKTTVNIPTGVTLKLDLEYQESINTFYYKVPNDEIDVYNVEITNSGTRYTVSADCCNYTESECPVILVIALFDNEDRVVAVGSSGQINLEDGLNITAAAVSSSAERAEAYIFTDNVSLRLFKNVIYRSK